MNEITAIIIEYVVQILATIVLTLIGVAGT